MKNFRVMSELIELIRNTGNFNCMLDGISLSVDAYKKGLIDMSELTRLKEFIRNNY